MKNLITRSLSGIVFVAVMVLGFSSNVFIFTCLQSIIILVSMNEFYQIFWGKEQHPFHRILGIATGLLLIAVMAGHLSFATLVLPWAGLFIVQLYIKKDETPFTTIAQTMLGVLYVAFPVAMWYFFVKKPLADFDGQELLGCFLILWSCDVGAYIFGRLFGRKGKHKLFPSLSPKKTWEGFFGGILCALITAYILYQTLFFPGKYYLSHCLAMAAIIAVFAVWGDLVESQLKRSFQIKDSGNLIPGHGGFLDRFDASFLAIPAAYFYLKTFGLM